MLLKKEYHPIMPNMYDVVTHESFCLFFMRKMGNSGQLKGVLKCLFHLGICSEYALYIAK